MNIKVKTTYSRRTKGNYEGETHVQMVDVFILTQGVVLFIFPKELRGSQYNFTNTRVTNALSGIG